MALDDTHSVLCGLIVVTALAGTHAQWRATRKDLAATPPRSSSTSEAGCICGAPGEGAPAVLDTARRPSVGWGYVNLMLLDSRASAHTTGQV